MADGDSLAATRVDRLRGACELLPAGDFERFGTLGIVANVSGAASASEDSRAG